MVFRSLNRNNFDGLSGSAGYNVVEKRKNSGGISVEWKSER